MSEDDDWYDYERDGPFNPLDRENESFDAFDLEWYVMMFPHVSESEKDAMWQELGKTYVRLRDAVKAQKIIYSSWGEVAYHPDRGGWHDEYWQHFHDVSGPKWFGE